MTSLLAGHGVPFPDSLVAGLVEVSSGVQAGGRGLWCGPPTGLVCGGLVGQRVRVARAVRVAGVGGLHERERGRAAVDLDRGDRHVRAGRGVHRPPLEVQAEAGQALGGPVGQRDVVAGQELVGRRVVDQVHVGVQAGVAAVAGVRVQPGAGRGQGVRPGRTACRGRAGGGAGPGGHAQGGGGGRHEPHDQRESRRSGERATVTGHLRLSLRIRRTTSILLNADLPRKEALCPESAVRGPGGRTLRRGQKRWRVCVNVPLVKARTLAGATPNTRTGASLPGWWNAPSRAS